MELRPGDMVRVRSEQLPDAIRRELDPDSGSAVGRVLETSDVSLVDLEWSVDYASGAVMDGVLPKRRSDLCCLPSDALEKITQEEYAAQRTR
ncbi:hypothetical protein [Natronococcus occultus]|uniref:Uncharacterized protein n=1 Tax=Natronococcus occultus SP4 TaxID=694430 RepID=L0K294_9EURY|nr:hypothetical protein [Natronococcus occultus]AGB38474.1 hypothetical protein Natoc_2713 [Natronococcus occultus SP4]